MDTKDSSSRKKKYRYKILCMIFKIKDPRFASPALDYSEFML